MNKTQEIELIKKLESKFNNELKYKNVLVNTETSKEVGKQIAIHLAKTDGLSYRDCLNIKSNNDAEITTNTALEKLLICNAKKFDFYDMLKGYKETLTSWIDKMKLGDDKK